jgi:GNAT superfamily N-acetyltransferase
MRERESATGSATDEPSMGPVPDVPADLVERYLCLSVDVRGYGSQDDVRQAEIQRDLVDLLDEAASRGGCRRSRWIRQAKGDEELALIPSDVPWQLIVGGFCLELEAALRRRARNPDAWPIRLRMGMDDGPVQPAANGFAGRAVVGASRLVNCQPVRQALALAAGTDLAVILSSGVYRDWVLTGRSRVPADRFRRVTVTEKEFVDDAWLWLPGGDANQLDLVEGQPPRRAVASGPAKPRNQPGGNLPWLGKKFTGRVRELADVVAGLTSATPPEAPLICAISGLPGVGKTTLAVRAARRIANTYPDGVIFFDLHGHSGPVGPDAPADLLERLLRRLGVPDDGVPAHQDDRIDRFQDRLRGQRILLVLDDARDLAQVRPLLPAEPGCAALVTSRSRMTALDEATLIALDVLPAPDASELFRSVAGTRAEHDPQAVARVAELCGNLPLAIRIVAARYCADPTQSLTELCDRLASERERLSELDDGDRSVAACLAVSFAALPAPQKQLFTTLGCHPGTEFDLTAAAALISWTVADTRPVAAGLVNRHLLDRVAPDRYRFHVLTADFAHAGVRGHANGPGGTDGPAGPASSAVDVAAVTGRLVDYYLSVTDQADRVLTPNRYRVPLSIHWHPGEQPWFPQSAQALRWLAEHEHVLVTVCQIAGENGLDSACWQLAYTLRGYFFLTKRWGLWERTHHLALGATRRLGDHYAEAMTLNNLGMAAIEQRHLETAEAHYRAALTTFEKLSDEHGMVSTRVNLAWVDFYQGRYQEFVDQMAEPLAFYRQHGSPRNAAITLRVIALARIQLGDLEAAIAGLIEARAQFEHLGSDLDLAMTLNALGEAHSRAGHSAAAAEDHRQALEFSQRCGSRYEGARAKHRLGQLTLAGSDRREARELLLQAYETYRELGAPQADELADLLAATAGSEAGPKRGVTMVDMRFEQPSLGDAQLDTLLVEAVAELRQRYPDYTGEHPLNPRTRFLVALVEGEPAGCVGIHPLDETRAEMKRLYVTPAHRGKGIARALVREVERKAAANGFRELLLETGIGQPEAITLYQSMGYESIAPYDGDYEPSPVSRCFAKCLTPAPATSRDSGVGCCRSGQP